MMKGLQAGSVASRAVDHLRTRGKGAEVAGAVICEAIGVEAAVLSSSLAMHVRSGMLGLRKVGRASLYSLGTGVPLAAEADDDPPQHRQVSAKGAARTEADPSNASIFAKAGAIPHPTTWEQPPRARRKKAVAPPEPKPRKKYKPRKKPGRRPPPATRLTPVVQAGPTPAPLERVEPELGVALFNTGELFLEQPGAAPVRLSRSQTQDLLAYLLKLDQLATPIAQRIAAS